MALTIVVLGTAADAEADALSLSFDASRVVIGRGEGCELRLPDPSVSHRHASLRQRGADYLVVDEGSTNGTVIGKVKLAPQSPRVIRSGERLRVGRVWLEVRIGHAVVPARSTVAADALALELVSRSLAAQDEPSRPEIAVLQGPDEGRRLTLEDPTRRYVVGRAKECELSLEDPKVSRRHVELGLRGRDVVARDVGGLAPATLGDARLGDADVAWQGERVLTVGDDVLGLHHPAAAALAEIEHAADERMRPDELVAEPVVDAPADVQPADPSLPDEAAPTPLPVVPEQEEGGWTATDAAVALAAVGVLALSIAGLFWLLH